MLYQEGEENRRTLPSQLLSAHCTSRKLTIKFIWASTCPDVAPPPQPKPRLVRIRGRPSFLGHYWWRLPSFRSAQAPGRPLAASPVPEPPAPPRLSSPGRSPGDRSEKRGLCSDASWRPSTTTTLPASTIKVRREPRASRAPGTPLAATLSAPTRAHYPDPPRPCVPQGSPDRSPLGRLAPLLSAAPLFPGHSGPSEPLTQACLGIATFCTCELQTSTLHPTPSILEGKYSLFNLALQFHGFPSNWALPWTPALS